MTDKHDWNTVGPLPAHGEQELYKVWREAEDGLIEEALFSFETEFDGIPQDMIPRGIILSHRVSLRVYSLYRSTNVTAARLAKMKMPPWPSRKRKEELCES